MQAAADNVTLPASRGARTVPGADENRRPALNPPRDPLARTGGPGVQPLGAAGT